MIMEQKAVVHVAFGLNHVMLVDKLSSLYAFGDGSQGCLGFGDGKKRFLPMLLSFFNDKRVIDVACGDSFTVVIAEVEGDPAQYRDFDYGDDGTLRKKTEL